MIYDKYIILRWLETLKYSGWELTGLDIDEEEEDLEAAAAEEEEEEEEEETPEEVSVPSYPGTSMVSDN